MSFLLYVLISPLPVLYHCVKVNLYSNVVVLWCVVVPVLAVAAPPHVHRGTDLFYRHSGHELQLCHTSRYSSLHLLTQCQYWCLSLLNPCVRATCFQLHVSQWSVLTLCWWAIDILESSGLRATIYVIHMDGHLLHILDSKNDNSVIIYSLIMSYQTHMLLFIFLGS